MLRKHTTANVPAGFSSNIQFNASLLTYRDGNAKSLDYLISGGNIFLGNFIRHKVSWKRESPVDNSLFNANSYTIVGPLRGELSPALAVAKKC